MWDKTYIVRDEYNVTESAHGIVNFRRRTVDGRGEAEENLFSISYFFCTVGIFNHMHVLSSIQN
jgi:hypothetical protein